MEEKFDEKEIKIFIFILLAFAIYTYVQFLKFSKKPEEKKNQKIENIIIKN